MSFAREGLVFILVAAAIALGAVFVAFSRRSLGLGILAVLLVVVALWVAYFFRDPEREGERGERLVVAPADGEIVQIVEVEEPAFIKGRATRISIFMNVFNVHVNRYPVSGVVRYVHYNEGKFVNAATDKASLENEQMSVGIESSGGQGEGGARKPVLVRQIAGLIARRIVNNARVADTVAQGQRMGMIRFGSRVDVFVLTGSTIRVKLGDKPIAGTTVLAEMQP